jgi:hypothetical protein
MLSDFGIRGMELIIVVLAFDGCRSRREERYSRCLSDIIEFISRLGHVCVLVY